ncbi:metal ABC transporter permease [Candidatus Woesearchaeota archaeon]|nr:metal ABC transporter permease [Candidatus Woesearchaeota archaeon]
MISYLIDPFQYEFMVRALIASLLVGIVCSILSCYLVVKKWALLGDAISHAVLPGVAIAFMLNIPFFIGALFTGIATALGIGLVTKYSKVKEDAAIGVMFTTAFAFGILLLSLIRAKSIDLYHILFGNVLGVSTTDMIITAVSGLVVLVTIILLFKELLLHAFDPIMASSIGLPTSFFHYLLMFLLSVTIVASLQTVGIVLVIAMLITPGAAAYLLVRRLSHMMLVAAGIGIVSSLAGLYFSYYLNVASGAMMVLVAGLIFLLAFLFSPREGVIWKTIRKRRIALNTMLEDCLLSVYRLSDGKGYVGIEKAEHPSVVSTLEKQKLANVKGSLVRLSPLGMKRATYLIKVHRLWETYLVEKADIPTEHVHDFAHKYEHITPVNVASEMNRVLNHPKRDPHGHRIPR